MYAALLGMEDFTTLQLLSLNLADAELIRNETAPDQTIDHTTVIYGGDDGQGADGHRQAVQGSEKAEILAMR